MTEHLAIGDVLTGAPRRFALERLYAFSGGPFGTAGWPARNTHTDDSAAGSPRGMFAAGTQFEGHVIALLVSQFGRRWFEGGKLDVRFIGSVYRDDVVTATATVTGVPAHGSSSYQFDVMCEKDDGTVVLVGTASVAGHD